MSINLTHLLNEDPSNPYCPTCLGDGYLTYVGGPGYFCSAYGNYLPTERDEPCDDCYGSGRSDDGSSPINAVRQHLRNLTPSQRIHLERLTLGYQLPITSANYQALEDLYLLIDNELGSKHPVTQELARAIDNSQIIWPASKPGSNNQRARIY